jgi:membrane associated rhomboid family serine protease
VLPYASDHRPSRVPVVTWTLLVLTTLLSLWLMLADRSAGAGRSTEMLAAVGLIPARMHPLTLFTYIFFHADPGHLVANLFYLYVFGAGVEEAVGRSRYILLYLAAGAVGGLLQWLVTVTLLSPIEAVRPIVGASAACAGLMGLFAVRYYRARLAFAGLPFRPHVVSVVGLFLLAEIGLGLYALIAGDARDGVAHWAHVGGFIFGLGCAQALSLSDAGSRAYLQSDAVQAMDRSVPGAAIKKWQRLLAREPDNPAVHEELARAWLLLGDGDAALQHYFDSLVSYLRRSDRSAASRIFAELHSIGLPKSAGDKSARVAARSSLADVLLKLTPEQLFVIGSALEAGEQFDLAIEAYRVVTMRAPNSQEAETALLKCAAISLRKLGRAREALALVGLFLDRYRDSPHRVLAEELRSEAEGRRD